jgi:hypothetical protein
MANGVATATFSMLGDSLRLETTMVTQKGAVSVANPTGQERPEVVELESRRTASDSQTTLRMVQSSSLLATGEVSVLNWEGEYREFQNMFFDLAEAYHAYFTNKESFILDFEFKKIDPDGPVIKQVRELPSPAPSQTAPILLNEPLLLQVSQGPRTSVFANHRLKSLWTVATDNRWLDEAGRASCFITTSDWQHTLQGPPTLQNGPVSSWTSAQHSVESDLSQRIWSVDNWTGTTDYGLVHFALKIALPKETYLTPCPIFTLADLDVALHANYPEPQMIYNAWLNTVDYTTNEFVLLEPAPSDLNPLPPAITNHYSASGNLDFEISSHIKPEFWPEGMTGYTPTVWRFEQTTVTGLLPSPLILQSYWSQTCQTYHKPYFGDMLFEPGLEPGLSPAQLQDLADQDVKLIFLRPERPWEQPAVYAIGFDGALRSFP